MSDQKKINAEETNDTPILQFLTEHRNKLELLLLANPKEPPLVHNLKGTRKTRTIYVADSLQKIMNDYCKSNNATVADLCEMALVRFLIANGFAEQIKEILCNDLI